jgi:hypothetical protein
VPSRRKPHGNLNRPKSSAHRDAMCAAQRERYARIKRALAIAAQLDDVGIVIAGDVQ